MSTCVSIPIKTKLYDNLSKYFDWLKKQSLHDINSLDKSSWYFYPLTDRL